MPRIPAQKTKPNLESIPAVEFPDPSTATATIEPTPVTTKPRPPQPPKRSVSEILRQRAEEASLLVAAGEEVLIALAKGQSPSPEEHALLVSLGLLGDRLDAEVRRMTRILNHQTRAGTEADRQQAVRNADEAAALLANRGPEIEQAVAELLAERSRLETSAAETRAICDRQSEAIKTLRTREFLPDNLRAELDDVARQTSPILARLHTLEGEITLTERLAALDVTDRVVIDHADSNGLSCYQEGAERSDPRKTVRSVDAAGWRSYLDQRRVDDKHRRAEIAEVQAELEPLKEKRERLLSHYVR